VSISTVRVTPSGAALSGHAVEFAVKFMVPIVAFCAQAAPIAVDIEIANAQTAATRIQCPSLSGMLVSGPHRRDYQSG
jgi:hypothetical protein